jgi:hypothetical protein
MKILFTIVFAAGVALQAYAAEPGTDGKPSGQAPGEAPALTGLKAGAPGAERSAPGPLSCLKAAEALSNDNWSSKRLSLENRIRLCAGAADPEAPIACFTKAGALEAGGKALSLDNKIRLCSGAPSAEAPINCFKAAAKLTATEWDSRPLSPENLSRLCSGAAAPEEPPACFTAAGKLSPSESGGKSLTPENKIKLCAKKP